MQEQINRQARKEKRKKFIIRDIVRTFARMKPENGKRNREQEMSDNMNRTIIKDIAIRYSIATLGLALVAVGVALSIKSNLGTAPVSCPPYVVNLIGGLTVGEYTIVMHFIFILLQLALLRKEFKAIDLMQIAAAFVFGFLTDAAIWAFSWVESATMAGRLILTAISVIITALGVSLEVIGNAWMLAGEMTDAAIAKVLRIQFRNAKIGFDMFLVIVSALIAYIAFHNPLGSPGHYVIGIGTLISAFFTGYCMKFTDKMAAKMFGRLLSKQ